MPDPRFKEMLKRSEIINEAPWTPLPGDMIAFRIVEFEKKSVEPLTFNDGEFNWDESKPFLSALDDSIFTVIKHLRCLIRDEFGMPVPKNREQVLLVTPHGIGWYEFNRAILRKVEL